MQVRAIMQAALHVRPSETSVGGPSVTATSFTVEPTRLHHYAVVVLVYRSGAAERAFWTRWRPVLRSRGFVGMRLENLIVLAARPGASLSVKARPFVMPVAVRGLLTSLRRAATK
jgi:hypothetical protein